jgi:UDP-perosamine 4-acetyltransferase
MGTLRWSPSEAIVSERFLIWGGGGHGKVVADLIRSMGATVVGFADRDAGKLGMVVEPGGAAVVVDEDTLLELLGSEAALPLGATALAIGIGDNAARLACAARVGAVAMPPLVHPQATVSVHAGLGRGTVVFANAVINAAACVGEAAIVNSGAVIEHDCIVGAGAHVAPGAVLTGGVRVGRGALVGARAVVLPGIAVGEDAMVGAGSVVNRDVERGVAVAGNPAHVIKRGAHGAE